MTTSLPNAALNPDAWIDLCALYPSIANSDVVIRPLSPLTMRIVHGGSTAPATITDGDPIQPQASAYANSDHIWVVGQGAVSIILL